MKRKVKLVVLLSGLLSIFFVQQSFSQTSLLRETRNLFFQAAEDKKQTTALITLLDNQQQPLSALMMGYKGAATAMDAENYVMPNRKYSQFKEGRKILEDAIIKDPENAELRFLRFQIQVHSPAFLGYQNQIEQDKKEVMKYLNLQHNNMTEDPDFLRKMVDAMRKSGKLTDEEKKLLMTLYN